MAIRYLGLKNFRNHQKFEVDFDPKVNIIKGPNGSGKTNILEAIYIICVGKSTRAVVEADLINHNAEFAKISAETYPNDKLELNIVKSDISSRVKKTLKINGSFKRQLFSEQKLSCVLFSPEDIRLVSGSPGRRREYINQILSQISVEYKRSLLKYERIVKHRNKILESVKGQFINNIYQAQLDIWSRQMIEQAVVIHAYRQGFFSFCESHISKVCEELCPDKFKLRLRYYPNYINEQRLSLVKDKEIRVGVTQVGPHRDDYDFVLHDNAGEFRLKNFGSRGQQRMAVLIFKVLELSYILHKNKVNPILLLDDIFSEFDKHFREHISQISKNQQTIITTADENQIPKDIAKEAKMISLSKLM